MDGSDTPGIRTDQRVTTRQSHPPHASSGRESRRHPTARMTARRPTVRPFFLYRGLMATNHRSVHPRAPVRGKYTNRTTVFQFPRADDRCPRGRRARRPTDRPTGARGGGCRRRPDARVVGIERRARGDAGRGDDKDVRARSRDDRRGRSRGGVGRRRENDGIGASETDAMRRDDRARWITACGVGCAVGGARRRARNAGAR